MTIPFDITPPPAARRVVITFNTDEDTAAKLEEMKARSGLERSMVIHRILKQALNPPPDGGERRQTERRSA